MPRAGCHRCGHPYALHSNGQTPCRAAGCRLPDGQPCPAYIAEPEPVAEDLRVCVSSAP